MEQTSNKKTSKPYSPEFRERAMRLAMEHRDEYLIPRFDGAFLALVWKDALIGRVRHGSAMTTHAVRAAIQRSLAAPAKLSRDFGINPRTVAKWGKGATVEYMRAGPSEPRYTVLSEGE
jgi:transposase-like protein